jgi:hypothetical protein
MRRATLAMLLVLTGCYASPDPASAPRAIPPTALEPPPVYSLLGYRQEIGLTSEQVTALDSIAEAVRRENAPLVQQLRQQNPPRAQQRGFILVDTAAQPALNQLRENNRRASDAVGEVLTAEQRTTACRILTQTQRDRMARRGAQQQQQQQQARQRAAGGVQADTVWTRGSGGWAWCAPAAPGAPAQLTPHTEVPMDTLTSG